MSDILNDSWVERFRPDSLASMVLPAPYRTAFEKYVESGNMSNVILYSSSAGTGKTSLAKAIVSDLDVEYLFINASIKTGVDIVRDQVTNFAQYDALNGKPKVVILDEFDGSSPQMQKALKSFIEEYHESCRFIVTTNSIVDIVPQLISRCKVFDFNFSHNRHKDEMIQLVAKRVRSILDVVKVPYEKESLLTLVLEGFPDIRGVLNACSLAYDMYGGINSESVSVTAYDSDLLDNIIHGKITAISNAMETNSDYRGVYTFIYRNLDKYLDMGVSVQVIPIISDYMWRESRGVIDSNLNFMSMCIQIRNVITKNGQ